MSPGKVLVKYYALETHNLEEITRLESNLERALLEEKNLRRSENTTVDEIADATGNGTSPLIDSEEFDVLYIKHRTEKKPVNARNVPFFSRPAQKGEYGVELVVKGTIEDILEIQKYLEQSSMTVREARTVQRAVLTFGLGPVALAAAKNTATLLKEIAGGDYKALKGSVVPQNEETKWGKIKGHTTKGYFSGPVEQLLLFRKIVIEGADNYGTEVKQESVTFE